MFHLWCVVRKQVWSNMADYVSVLSAQIVSHKKLYLKWLSRRWQHVFCRLHSKLYSLIGSRNAVVVSRAVCEVEKLCYLK